MAGRRPAPLPIKRPLRAFAVGSSLSFSIVLLWLAPASATPSHSKPPKTAPGHATPVPLPVASAPVAPAAAPALSGAGSSPAAGSPAGAGVRATAKHAVRHPAAPAAKAHHTPAAGGSGLARGHSGGAVGASAGEASGSLSAAVTREQLKVTHGRTGEAKRGRHTPKAAAVQVAEGANGAATATAAVSAASAAVAPAPAPSAAATPAASTPAGPSSGVPPSGAVHRHRAAPRRAAKPRGAGARAVSGVLGFTAATPTEALGAKASASGGSGGERQGAAPRPAARPHSESPIVTTVTKIISVVPPVWRWLIGGLLALAIAFAVVSQVEAVRARRLARQRRELLDDVGLLQAALLPPLPRRLGPVATSAAYRPASGPGAGGDFYDVFALGDGRLALIVGDVSGHGRHALPRTTLVRFTLRAYLEAGMEPRAALQMAGPVLERQLGEAFATVVLATYDPGERTLTYSCAGHPPPVVAGTDTLSPITVCSAPPLGVGSPTGTRQTTVALPGAAAACFFTDGVVEARVQGQLFGASRLERMVSELEHEATATTVLDRVSGIVDRRPDDMAACLLRFDGEPAAPEVLLEEIELDGRSATRERVERFLLAGGMHPADVEAAAARVRRAVAEHGTAVLELRYTDGAPEATVRPLNAAMLQAWRAETASAQEMAG